MKRILALLLILILLSAASAETWTCLSCGKESDGKFCPYCGEAKPPIEFTCTSCGEVFKLEAGYLFCPNCGAALSETTENIDINALSIGDIISFGHYDQDNDETNGAEDIEWIVLDKSEETVTLISKYGLEAKPYNTESKGVTWETCTLRKWLNDDFLNTAFTAEEQARIVLGTVTADKNPEYSTDPGNDTRDKVFLLSIDEATRYFGSMNGRLCVPTDTAVANGAHTNRYGYSWWWLRSPGGDQDRVPCVRYDGKISLNGPYVYTGGGVVRPVVVLQLLPNSKS